MHRSIYPSGTLPPLISFVLSFADRNPTDQAIHEFLSGDDLQVCPFLVWRNPYFANTTLGMATYRDPRALVP